jgi:hypothetical protein
MFFGSPNDHASMKTLFTLFVTAVLLCGCSSTKFTEFRGGAVVEGKGGTVRNVDGIDFWENGEPNHKYRAIGVIDDSRGDGLVSRLGKDSAIAKAARERGGDAVILVRKDREISGVNQYGNVNYTRITKLVVVKYVE